MAIKQLNWQKWSISLIAVLAAVIGIWYLQTHGQINEEKNSSSEMAGMDMPGTVGAQPGEKPAESSTVPGHAAINVSADVQQRIGVTLATVQKQPLRMTVQTVGIIEPNETKISLIHLRTTGWVQKMFVNFTGQAVQKDDPLLAIYSPDFLVTQQNYLSARRAERSGGLAGEQGMSQSVRRRLELLDLPEQDIDKLDRTGQAEDYITLRSPINGTVLEKNVQEKEYVTPEKQLYMIADLSTVWVQAKAYEYELPHIELGQPATVTIPALPNREFTGKVVFIQPTVEEATRTVQVRIELPNEDGSLKPGMFAHITIAHPMGEGLLVPTSAIIRTGEKDIAFRVKASGEFVPVEVKISEVNFGDRFHVLEGLEDGDKVVTSANFLIDSESRLREGAGGMAGMPGMEGMDLGNAKGTDHSSTKGMDQSKDGKAPEIDHSQMQHER